MKEIYRLDEAQPPALITPHDCKIKEIKKENGFLVFVFEDDISYNDSVKYVTPKAKSLIIKYHLTDTYGIYRQRFNKLLRRLEYIELKNESSLFGTQSEYLYQYVMYNQLIIKLFNKTEYMLTVSADYAEYDWIEQ